MSESEIQLSEKELTTAIVYGDTFSVYDKKSFREFIDFFVFRLQKNNIEPSVFKGKRCIDAGCGGGRGTIMMLEAGAKEVVAFDMTPKNIEHTTKRAESFGVSDRLTTVRGNLLEMPFKDEEFDLVWCNGVLHHTTDPDLSLKEVSRILKVGGKMWLYLYGSGGLYWKWCDHVRDFLGEIQVEHAIPCLRMAGFEIRRIAEWIDNWFVPCLNRYTDQDVADRLKELGFTNTERLYGGTNYDTSTRRHQGDEREKMLMGEGDLRYFCTKKSAALGTDNRPLPAVDEKGSKFEDSEEVLSIGRKFEEVFDIARRLEKKAGGINPFLRLLVARSLHVKVRDLLETDEKSYDTSALLSFLEDQKFLLGQLET